MDLLLERWRVSAIAGRPLKVTDFEQGSQHSDGNDGRMIAVLAGLLISVTRREYTRQVYWNLRICCSTACFTPRGGLFQTEIITIVNPSVLVESIEVAQVWQHSFDTFRFCLCLSSCLSV